MARYMVLEFINDMDMRQVYEALITKAREIAGLSWERNGCYIEPIFMVKNRLVVKVPNECLTWIRAAMVLIDGVISVKVTGTARKAKAQALSIKPIFSHGAETWWRTGPEQ